MGFTQKLFHKVNVFEKDDTYNLRGLCMIAIIIHHLYQFLAYQYGFDFGVVGNIFLQALGYLATSVFFLVSGFGLYYSICKQKKITAKYIFLHYYKLILPFIFVWLISAISFILYKEGSLSNITNTLLNLSLPQGGCIWFFNEILILYGLVYLTFSLVENDIMRLSGISILVLLWVYICAFQLKWGSNWYNSVLCFPIGLWISYYKLIHKDCWKKNYRLHRLVKISVPLFFVVFFVAQSINPSRYCQAGLEHFCKSIALIGSAISFSVISIIIVSRINIRCGLFRYYGRHSLIFYISQIFLLSFYEIKSPLAYSALVVFGSLFMVLLYSPLEKFVERIINSFERNIINNKPSSPIR